LRAAVKEARRLAKSYKKRLTSKVRLMQKKLAEAQATSYTRWLRKSRNPCGSHWEEKKRSLIKAVASIERKHAAKLTKSLKTKKNQYRAS